jgi:hypothetical protein
MNTKELVSLMFSPPWTAKLMHHFLSGAQSVNVEGVKIELIYLLIPFVTDNETRVCLAKTNSRGTLSSAFKSKGKDGTTAKVQCSTKDALLKKNHQINQYREITNHALIYLGSRELLNMGKFASVGNTLHFRKEPEDIREYCKAAFYLGVIFAKEDYRNLIVKLGVTNL